MRAFEISVTYTPSVRDQRRLDVPDMRAYVMAALENIFERENLSHLEVVERDRQAEQDSSLSSVGEMP